MAYEVTGTVVYKIGFFCVNMRGAEAGCVSGEVDVIDAAGNVIQTRGFNLPAAVVMPEVLTQPKCGSTYECISNSLYKLLSDANVIPKQEL
jgi:hypothetical protein